MKRIFFGLFNGLTLKQKAIVIYFGFSLSLLCITEEAPLWFLGVELINFINAARLLNQVPVPEDDNDEY